MELVCGGGAVHGGSGCSARENWHMHTSNNSTELRQHNSQGQFPRQNIHPLPAWCHPLAPLTTNTPRNFSGIQAWLEPNQYASLIIKKIVHILDTQLLQYRKCPVCVYYRLGIESGFQFAKKEFQKEDGFWYFFLFCMGCQKKYNNL